MYKENNLRFHYFISHIFPIIQIILFTFALLLATISFFSQDREIIITAAIAFLSYIPPFIFCVSILSVKNELTEKSYKRIRTYYYYFLIINCLSFITGVLTYDTGSTGFNLIWIVFSIVVLTYYKRRKEIFCNPWNDHDTLFCRKCGFKLVNGSVFCQNCGERVD